MDAAALKVSRFKIGIDYCVLYGQCDWAVEWMLLPCSEHVMLTGGC